MRALAIFPCVVLLLGGCGSTPATTSAVQTRHARPDSIAVRLRSRTIVLTPATTHAFVTGLHSGGDSARYGLAWAPTTPDRVQRAAMARDGVALLASHRGHVYWARVARAADTSTSLFRSMLFAALEASDRVAPELWGARWGAFSTRRGPDTTNHVLNTDGSVNLLVHFHEGVGRAAAERLIRPVAQRFESISATIWSVTADSAAMRMLATSDIVRWIDPAGPPLSPDSDNMRKEIRADGVQDFDLVTGAPKRLGGLGVQVSIFDFGIDESHDDFAGRVAFQNVGSSTHATQVAGVLAGSGTLSTGADSWGVPNAGTPYQWRGVAPQAELLDVTAYDSFTPDAAFSYITVHGEDISNHSNSYSKVGAYWDFDFINDGLIRGDAKTSSSMPIPARLRVYSTGNDGDTTYYGPQVGYFSLTKQLKNGLVVGNYDAANKRIHFSSSLGPAYDGRIKPDVVAPGTAVKTTGFCVQSTNPNVPPCTDPGTGSTQRRDYYLPATGSSIATPVVTGMLSLVLQQYAATNGPLSEDNRPRPATLRAIAIHSARDIAGGPWFDNEDDAVEAFDGPDFVTGFGLVDALSAVAIVAEGRTIEDFVASTCDVREYSIDVPRAGLLRVTLAWDDAPSDVPSVPTDPKLVNDLDLELVSPSLVAHHPFLLDQLVVDEDGVPIADSQQLCGQSVSVTREVVPTLTPKFIKKGDVNNENDPFPSGALKKASQGKDHLNNVEQVVVKFAERGTWTIRVTGFMVPEAPQTFSLITESTPYILIDRGSVCKHFVICSNLFRFDPCSRYPVLCEALKLPILRGVLPVQFASTADRFMLPLDRACLFADRCAPCVAEGLCDIGRLRIDSISSPMTVEVFERGGRRVFSDHSKARSKVVQFKARPGREYVLVIGPTSPAQVGRTFNLPILVGQ